MVSQGYTPKTNVDILKNLKDENVKQWSRANDSTGGIGSAGSIGGSAEQIGNTGAFLPITGGVITGALLFRPITRVIGLGRSIDISNGGIGASRAIVAPGGSSELSWILGNQGPGHYLIIQGIETATITIKNRVQETNPDGTPRFDAEGTPVFNGNIETINEMDVTLEDDDNLIFIFDSTDNAWQQITPSHIQQVQIGSETAIPISYPLSDLGDVGGITRAFNVNVPPSTQGYRLRLTGSLGIVLTQNTPQPNLREFFLVIQQDPVGNRSITQTDGAIVNATMAEIDSLLNKSPNAITIFKLTNPGNTNQWFIENVGLGTVTGGSTPNNIAFADITGQIARTQIANMTIQDNHIESLVIEKLRTTPANSARVLVSGDGGNTANFWGDLDDVIGGISPANVRANSTNNGQVLQVTGGNAGWSNFNLSEVHDVESSSAAVGNLLLRSLSGGQASWVYGKLSDEYINNKTIGIDKLRSVAQDRGHFLISGGTGANFWGTLANVEGNLPIDRLGTVASDRNHALISGGGMVDNFWGTLANIEGNLPAGRITSGVFDQARIPNIDITKLNSDRSDAGHVLIAGGNAPNTWGTLANIQGSLPITRISTVSQDAGHVLISGGTSTLNTWGTLTNIAGNLSASRITSGTFSQDRIPNIDISKINSTRNEAGHVLIGGTTNSWGTLANIVGRINATTQIAGGSSVAGRYLRATSSGTEWATIDATGGGATRLDDLSDVNIGSSASANTVLKFFRNQWVDGLITDENVSNINANKITAGTISTSRLPSTWVTALSSYQTSEGTIESRLDALENISVSSFTGNRVIVSSSTGVLTSSSITSTELASLDNYDLSEGRIEERLDRLETVTAGANSRNGNVLSGSLFGIQETSISQTVLNSALRSYQTSEGSIESRLDALESGGSGSRFNDIQITGSLNHDGSSVGFYGRAPTSQGSWSRVPINTTMEGLVVKLNQLADLIAATGLIRTFG